MRRSPVLVAVLSVLAASAARADGPAPARLVERLASEDFAEREQATAALEALGAEALPALRAARDHPDAEVRRRAAEVLQRVERRCLTAEMLRPARLRLAYRDQPLGEVLQDVSRRTGYRAELTDGQADLAARRVTVDTGEADCWEVLDRFFAQAGLSEGAPRSHAILKRPDPLSGHQSGSEPVVRHGPRPVGVIDGKGRSPSFVAGALRLRALPPLPVAGPPRPSEETLLRLEACVGPGLTWLGLASLRIDRALDEQGEPLANLPTLWEPPEFSPDERPAPDCEPVLSVRHGEKPTRRLRELRGTLAAHVRREGETLARIDLPGTAGQSFPCADGSILRVRRLTDEGDGAWRMDLDVEASRSDEAAADAFRALIKTQDEGRVLLSEKDGTCPFTALDAGGARVRLATGHFYANGSVRNYTLYFQAAKDQTDPVRLVYVGPRTALVEVPFVLHDVPLVAAP
jgi:hypothetical protein